MTLHAMLMMGTAHVPGVIRPDVLHRLLYERRQDVIRHRIMVAEFVARQSGSPINGETPSLNSTMPGSHSASNSTSGGGGGAGAAGGAPGALNGGGAGGPGSAPGVFPPDAMMMDVSGPPSPDANSVSGDAYPHSFDLHLKRKELFSQRKQREFIPDNKKDESYWDRRRRNNEAAKRSREKRRFNDMILETRVVELTKENHVLKAQLAAFKDKYGVCGESLISVEQVMATLPTTEQVLSFTKRPKLTSSGSHTPLLYAPNPSPIPTPVIHQPVSAGMAASPPPAPLYPTQPHQHPAPHHPQLPLPHPHPLPHLHAHPAAGPEPVPFDDAAAYSYPYHLAPHQPHQPQPFESGAGSVLNLSRSAGRARSRAQSPYELSSGSGDESSVPGPLPLTVAPSGPTNAANHNSLPHKLRHKSHLGDKDAATTLLSLQNIKQEPGPRASPPWDGEGSSDERDSGISLGVEWTGNGTNSNVGPASTGPLNPQAPQPQTQQPQQQQSQQQQSQQPAPPPPHHMSPHPHAHHPHPHHAHHPALAQPMPAASPCHAAPVVADIAECAGDDVALKNELARLASEVATIKNFLNSKNSAAGAAPAPAQHQ